MRKFYIKHEDGRAFSLWGWIGNTDNALVFTDQASAEQYRNTMSLAKATVAPVPVKLAPGMTALEKPIFSNG